MDLKVKEYIGKQSEENKKVILALRKILMKTVPDLEESMQWGVICYGDYFYIAVLPKQVNMGFSIIGLSPDEIKLFEGSGKTMRHVKVKSLDSIDKKGLVKRIKLVRKKAKPVHS